MNTEITFNSFIEAKRPITEKHTYSSLTKPIWSRYKDFALGPVKEFDWQPSWFDNIKDLLATYIPNEDEVEFTSRLLVNEDKVIGIFKESNYAKSS